LNLVVLTAALSVCNSGVYCNSRMLLGLAEQGDAPGILARINDRGVPVPALAVSAAATALCVLVNYLIPAEAFQVLMMLVVAALVINWGMISLTHLKFRARMDADKHRPAFLSPLAPWSNYLCLTFMAGILAVMALTPGMGVAVLLMPLWVALLGGIYWLRRRAG